MRRGPYSAGRQAGEFLLRRLRQGPVAVSQLEAAAGQEEIARATLYRAAERLGVVRMSTEAGRLWALSGESVPVENVEPAGALAPVSNGTAGEGSGVESEVTETDPRVERLVAEACGLISRGIMRREVIVHRIRKAWGAELADQVKAVLEA